MLSSTTLRKTATTVAALGAFGLGASAIASADDTSTSAASSSSGTAQTRTGRTHGRQALSSDVAAKVKAAALAKAPGSTVLRTGAGGPSGAAYHAHIRASDGTQQVVLVDSSFNATAAQADQGRGGRGKGGRGGRGNETALASATKQQAEAAVLRKYATIVRSETNADGSAPYEAHITTSHRKQLEVHVSEDFAVVDATAQPARP